MDLVKVDGKLALESGIMSGIIQLRVLKRILPKVLYM